MDLITGLPLQGGRDAILTIVDHGCSHTAIFLPCNTTITGPEIAQLYFEHVFRWYGLPQKIISDCDPRFTSHFGKSIAEKLHIKQNLSTTAHPQTDGLSECKNQWIEQTLRILTTILPEAWPEYLPLATAIHNNRKNATTLLSPNQILIGYNVPINPENIPIMNNDTIEDQSKMIEQYRDTATRLINQIAGTAPVMPSAYQIGSEVWLDATNLCMMGTNTKIDPLRYGPFKIVKEISLVAYQLDLPPGWKIHDMFHASLLSPYTETNVHRPNFVRPPPELIQGEKEYEVECIINHRNIGQGKALQYLIKWKGYPESDNTWEPTSHLHALQLIKEYQRRIGKSSIKAMLKRQPGEPSETLPPIPHPFASPSPHSLSCQTPLPHKKTAEMPIYTTDPKPTYSARSTQILDMHLKHEAQREQPTLMRLSRTLRSWRSDSTVPSRSWMNPSTRCARRSKHLSRTSSHCKTMSNSWGTMSAKKPLPLSPSYSQAVKIRIMTTIMQALEEAIQSRSRDTSPSRRVMSQPQVGTSLSCFESYRLPPPLRRDTQVMY
jgi:Chromo (CHRromatin Organisation MOdifier) domain